MDGKKSANVIAFVYGGYLMRYVYLIIVVPFYGRVLGVAEYGRVLAAMSLMNVIWMLASYGFTFVGMREISKAQNNSECNAIYSLHTSARLALCALGACIGVVATFCSPTLSERPLIGLLATTLGVVSALNLGWLYQGRLGRPHLSFSGIASLVKGSTMLFCYSSGSVVLTASSTYLLTLLSTPAQVGYFGAAERFATIGLSLMGPASQVFIPTISRQLAQGDKAGAHSTTRRGATLMLGYGLLVFCGALTLSPIVLRLILGEAFTPSGHVLQCFAWMFPFAAFNEFAAFYVFVPRKKDRLLAIAGAASGVANLVAALYLAPRYGAEGMAFARVIGELSLSAMLLTIMVRLELITLVPGAGRAIAMARVAWGTRGQAGAGKED